MKVAAGTAGTDPLSKAERLDELPADADPSHGQGPATRHAGAGHHHGGPHGPGGPTTDAADEGDGDGSGIHGTGGAHSGGGIARGGSAGDGAGGTATQPSDAPENAAGRRIRDFARGLTGPAIGGIGADTSGDGEFVAAAGKGLPGIGRHGGADDDDAGDGSDQPGATGLMAPCGGSPAASTTAARNWPAERATVPGRGRAVRASPPRPAVAASASPRLRQAAYERSHGFHVRNDGARMDLSQYGALTTGIHERDAAAARGRATTPTPPTPARSWASPRSRGNPERPAAAGDSSPPRARRPAPRRPRRSRPRSRRSPSPPSPTAPARSRSTATCPIGPTSRPSRCGRPARGPG